MLDNARVCSQTIQCVLSGAPGLGLPSLVTRLICTVFIGTQAWVAWEEGLPAAAMGTASGTGPTY